MIVPFVDLSKQYLSIKTEIDNAIASVIGETTFIGGRFVTAFEEQFAKAYGVKHVISCGNGTDSLYIIMKMLGIGPGDEVITAANTWISDSETITQTGARVVFADVHPDYYSIDETLLEAKITNKTKALLVVHFQGQVCEMKTISAICKKHSIYLIEDCAQAHFSECEGKRTGLFGAAASFSFYPTKNLGAFGDAGCMITNDDVLAQKLRMYAQHGALKKNQHKIEGVNSRMDSMQAAILSAKLPYIHQWTDSRIRNAKLYDQLFDGIPEISLPKVRPGSKHTFHLYVIRCQNRDGLSEFLKLKGVETLIHYPTLLPYSPAYSYLRHQPEDFPVGYKLQGEILSLPMSPELSDNDIAFVADAIKSFYANSK